jgi:hypothetical protein
MLRIALLPAPNVIYSRNVKRNFCDPLDIVGVAWYDRMQEKELNGFGRAAIRGGTIELTILAMIGQKC